MYDGSIYTEKKSETGYAVVEESEYSVEMVTPKLTYAELPKLQECVRQVRHAGAKVNNTCGIHVHVDAANHNLQRGYSVQSIAGKSRPGQPVLSEGAGTHAEGSPEAVRG